MSLIAGFLFMFFALFLAMGFGIEIQKESGMVWPMWLAISCGTAALVIVSIGD